MKSGLMALAIAMIELKENDALPHGTIKFMATAGEEKEQLGSAQLYKKGYMNNVDALIIAEPSETNIVYAHKDRWIIKSLLKEKPHTALYLS